MISGFYNFIPPLLLYSCLQLLREVQVCATTLSTSLSAKQEDSTQKERQMKNKTSTPEAIFGLLLHH